MPSVVPRRDADDEASMHDKPPQGESGEPQIHSAPTKPPPSTAISGAFVAVELHPDDDAAWDKLEEIAAAEQRPDDVAELFRNVLARDLPKEVIVSLAQRAVRFHDEWFGEPEPLVEVLTRVLAVEPDLPWAFERLSLVYTMKERWDELLALYDRSLAATTDDDRKRFLLGEAANAAKDFARQPDRAIGYLAALVPLRPQDGQIAAQLERLLESRGRHADLIQLWTTRLPVLPKDQARATRIRIATCFLESLKNPSDALAVLEKLLAEPGDETAALALVERIAASADAEADTRRKALALAKDRHAKANRSADVVRVLRASLPLADVAEKIAAHREITERLVESSRPEEAMEDVAAILALDASDDAAHAKLAELADATGKHARYADALVHAADATEDGARKVALLVEAGNVRADRADDEPGAIAALLRAFESGALARGEAASVGRRLVELLDRADRPNDVVRVLEQLADLSDDAAETRAILARVAKLADEANERDRALAAWRKRLARDPADREALDATIDALERTGRWEELVEALGGRAKTTSGAERRADLVRAARVLADPIGDADRAAKAWAAIKEEFGSSDDVVDALAALYDALGRWEELGTMLASAAETAEPTRKAELLTRLGDVHRERLAANATAAEHYEAALAADPSSAGARAGLAKVLDDPACEKRAAQALVRAFESTGDVAAKLELLEPLLRVAEDDDARALLLLDAASLYETNVGDAHAALRCVGRALAMAPADAAIEAELGRLGEANGAWDVVADAYEAALGGGRAAEARATELRMKLGAVREERLGDLAGALAAYGEVAHADPARLDASTAVVRTAARLGEFGVLATAIVEASRAAGSVAPVLFEALEANVGDGGWDGSIVALEQAVAGAEGLVPSVVHDLEQRIAVLHRDRRADDAAAEAALLRAAKHDGSRRDTLAMLAAIQRKHPGRPLVDTLLRLADTEDDAIETLREAAAVALDAGDGDLAAPILDRLLRTASSRWKAGETTLGDQPSHHVVAWALDRLVATREAAGQHAAAVDLLVESAALPFDRATARGLLHRAAALAAGKLCDAPRAIELYREILRGAPEDLDAIAELSSLYRAGRQLDELVKLREHELGLATTADRRVAIRLEVARTFAELGDEQKRAEALLANLAEVPGDEASIAELRAAYEAGGRFADLEAALRDQATLLEKAGEPRARELWEIAADVAETKLGDAERAIEALRRGVALEKTPASLDALARLHVARGDHVAAVDVLEQRLAIADASERSSVVRRLAEAFVGAGRLDRARAVLESALADGGDPAELRAMLADLYRKSKAHRELVELLLASVEDLDGRAKVDVLSEIAFVQAHRLDAPADAVATLQRAAELAPQDRAIRTSLADALRAAGQLDEARAILESLIEEFGRRRPPERASLHFQLAQVARSRGDVAGALQQLDTAASMDMAHAGVLSLLGHLAIEAGQLDRAERAYRALLLVVRRQKPGEIPHGATEPIGQGEVLFALSRIAEQMGQADRARELLESAFETAGQNDAEAERLETVLRDAGASDLLLRSLEARAARAPAGPAQAAVLADLGRALEAIPGRENDALDAMLRAASMAPASPSLHAAARSLAKRLGASLRYATVLDELATNGGSVDLLLLLGDVLDEDLGDGARALDAYRRAEATGQRLAECWRAMAKTAARAGDRDAQRAALRHIVEASDADVAEAEKTDALYGLAAIELADPSTHEQGVATLTWALDRDPQHQRALDLLAAPAHAGGPQVVALYERVARAANDPKALLDALELLSASGEAGGDAVREAVDLALAAGEGDRAEALLRRAVEQAEAAGSPADATWALVLLAERRKAAGDWDGAVKWLERAAAIADEREAFPFVLEIAQLASGPMNDLALAAKTYESLLERDPADRAVWAPLLDTYRRMGEGAKLEALIARTVDAVYDPADRRKLRIERARVLLDGGRTADAIAVLDDNLQEEPDDAETATLLLDVLERSGDDAKLVELLARLLEGARGRVDAAQIAELTTRLANRLGGTRRDEAIDVYRASLAVSPDDERLLEAFHALLQPTDDPAERSDVALRLAARRSGEEAARLALEAASLRESAGDDAGVEEALVLAFQRAPSSGEPRARLERFYATHAKWPALAEHLVAVASEEQDPAQKVARYRQAAAVWSDQIGDPAAAANALRSALLVAPDDVSLVLDLAHALEAAGDHGAAVGEVSAAIDRGASGAHRVELLRARAELRLRRGEDEASVHDLEEALALGSDGVLPDLVAALEHRRTASASRGDGPSERAATMRLAQLLAADPDRSRALLADWTARNATDVEALHALADLDAAAGRWWEVVQACGQLLQVEEGDAQIATALRLADACEKAGHPGEARASLEHMVQAYPSSLELVVALRHVYEVSGAHRELAALLLHEANELTDPAAKLERYKHAGELYLAASDPEAAIPALEAALHLRAADHDTTVKLADAYIATSKLEQATQLIDAAIAAHKGRRSKELAVLQHRMARIAQAAGDRNVELAWLNVALDADMQNGHVASELADVATELGQLDVALKALRAVTMMKSPGPMTKAMAYLRQGMIAYHQGDARKAIMLAKKAQAEDPHLGEAKTFLQQIGGA